MNFSDLIKKAEQGIRLSFEDGVRLFRSKDLLQIGKAANLARRRMNGRRTYYIVNRHINYTNICKNRCRFCAFSRTENQPGAYTLSIEDILHKAEKARKEIDYRELHIVGGLHPHLKLDYYLEMLKALRKTVPHAHIQAFTAVEIKHLADISGLSVEETLEKLVEAGLGSIPGGGAEVFSTRIRNALCPEKLPPDEWLHVMRTAHRLGIKSNATMLYGHIETPEEKVEHLICLRELQDETNGFLAFIPLAYHPDGTNLGAPNGNSSPSGIDDLKTIAISRLMLDNFPHIKAFWIMLGLKLAQVALNFGADDFDGTVVEEHITHSAGAKTPEGLTIEQIQHLIRETDTLPVERDTLYNEVKR